MRYNCAGSMFHAWKQVPGCGKIGFEIRIESIGMALFGANQMGAKQRLLIDDPAKVAMLVSG